MISPRKSVRTRLVEEFYTYCAFWIFVSALPVLTVSYICKYFYIFFYFISFFYLFQIFELNLPLPRAFNVIQNLIWIRLFPVVRVCKYLWLKLLSSRYPHLEFIWTDTVRSLLDTHRNQGIINVLLSVQGMYNANIRSALIYWTKLIDISLIVSTLWSHALF